MKLQVTIEGKIYNVGVEILEEDSAERLTGAAAPVAAPAPIAFPSPLATAPVISEPLANTENACVSPVTGLVIRIAVEPGQAVLAGDLVATLEAMKMETSVTAPRDGVVKEIKAAEGDAVKFNQVLVEFE